MSSIDDKFNQELNKINSKTELNNSDYNFLHKLTSLYGDTLSAKGINVSDPVYANLFYYNKLQNMSLVDGPRVNRCYAFFTRPELNFSYENISTIPFFRWMYSKTIGKMVMCALSDPEHRIYGKTFNVNEDSENGNASYLKNLIQSKNASKADDGILDIFKESSDDINSIIQQSNSELSGMGAGTNSTMNSIWDAYDRLYNRREFVDSNVLPSSKYMFSSTHKTKNVDVFNYTTPFIPLLGNTVTSISGAKSISLENYSYEEDDFSSNLQVPTGMDSLWNSGSLSVSFDDIIYSPVNLLFLLWTYYIHYVARGYISPTKEHVTERILDYTCSIYVFVIGTDGRTIERFCKYTGCYPTSVDNGGQFDFNKEIDPDILRKIQVTFNYNRYEMMNPEIFTDFNFVSQSEWLYKLNDWDHNSYSRLTDSVKPSKFVKVDTPGMSGQIPREVIQTDNPKINDYWGGYPYINNMSELIWVLPK